MAIGTGAAILGAAGIGALANRGGSGGNTQSSTSSAPWDSAQPYWRDLFGRANTQSYGSQSPLTTQAQQMQQQRALAGNPLNQAAQSQNLATLNGDYLNPYTKGAVGDVMDMAKGKINSQFNGDNFGNSAHQEWLGRGLMSASMPYAQQAYDTERQRQMGASALAPTLANQDYFDINQLGAVGQQQQDFPWQQYQRMQGVLSGAGGGASTTQQPYFINPIANALGMGVGGLGLYNGLNQSGLFGTSGLPSMGSSSYNPLYGQM